MSCWGRCGALLLMTGMLAACPEPREPSEPLSAVPCDAHTECNCGSACGVLSACVDGYCEAGRSLLVPCRDGQQERTDNCDP